MSEESLRLKPLDWIHVVKRSWNPVCFRSLCGRLSSSNDYYRYIVIYIYKCVPVCFVDFSFDQALRNREELCQRLQDYFGPGGEGLAESAKGGCWARARSRLGGWMPASPQILGGQLGLNQL